MFKLIETIEQNEKNFTVVPKSWEYNGILYWPEHKKKCEIDKLRKNHSSSSHTNWVEIKCEVKAVAATFIEGLQLEKLYSSFTDTESEERYIESCNTNNNKRKIKQKADSILKDYNVVIEDITNSDGILDNTAEDNKIIITSQDNLLFSNEQVVEDIIVSQNIENSKMCIPNENEVDVLPNNVILQNDVENSTPIVDFLFTPQLLNKYTWTGSSKTSDKKECFQKLSNVGDLIYELVFMADCRHSKYRNELNLKDKILKHTSQRLNRKRMNGNLAENN